ncbi:MAG: hypothetical protein N2C14_21730 [Planctomycetales bacterium]
MRDVLGWNLTFGRWGGVPYRLHFFFLMVGLFVVYACSTLDTPGVCWKALAGVGVAFFCVMLHELAHLGIAVRSGGEVTEVLLWPLGGLAIARPPAWTMDDRVVMQQQLAVSAAGPILNFVACAATLPAVLLLKVPLIELWNPLAPPFGADWTWLQILCGMFFWCNWVLFAANLLPASPFDRGNALRTVLVARFGREVAMLWSVHLAKFVAFVLFVLALVVAPHESHAVPAVLLILVSVFVFAATRADEPRFRENEDGDSFLGYDFSQGYTSLEQDEAAGQGGGQPVDQSGPIKRWLDNRKAAKQEKQRVQDEEDETLFDKLLIRIHEQGWESLTEDEREFARRYSERYRRDI